MYSIDVHCVLYRLRHFGERLPPEEVKARARAGRLRFGNIHGTSQPHAELLDAKGVQCDEIRMATIVKIDAGGVLITGFEQHPGRGATRQTWWCVAGLMDDLTAG